MAGIIILVVEKHQKNKYLVLVAGGIIIFLLMFQSQKLFNAQKIINSSSKDYLNEQELKWNASKISDEYLPKDFEKPGSISEIPVNKVKIINGDGEITEIFFKTGYLRFTLNSTQPTSLIIHIAPFPGWQIFLNNKFVNNEILGNGLKVKVPKGKNLIEAKLEQTQIQSLANLLSLVGIFILILGIISPRKLKI